MTRRMNILAALATGAALLMAGTALAQADASGSLRASGNVGEQADGYLGVVGQAPASVREQVNAINIKRRAFYTDIARDRGATVQEVAVKTACTLLQNKVRPGEYYRLPGGDWQKRDGAIALPAYCG